MAKRGKISKNLTAIGTVLALSSGSANAKMPNWINPKKPLKMQMAVPKKLIESDLPIRNIMIPRKKPLLTQPESNLRTNLKKFPIRLTVPSMKPRIVKKKP